MSHVPYPSHPIVSRELRESDWPSILDAFQSDPEMVRQGNVTDQASALAYVRQFVPGAMNALARVAVDDHDDVVAFAAITIDQGNHNGWTFYWAHPRARRQGITSALVKELANNALRGGELFRLELGYRANNPGSAAVALAAGFIQEGVERQKFLIGGKRVDVVTCSRLATDPFPA